MKKFLASGMYLFLGLSANLIAMDVAESNILKNYIYDQIDIIDDEINISNYDIKSIDNICSVCSYRIGYYFGKREAYYELLIHTKQHDNLKKP